MRLPEPDFMTSCLLLKGSYTTCISFTGTLGSRQEPSYRRTSDRSDRCGRHSAAPRSNSVMQETASRAMHILVFLARWDRVFGERLCALAFDDDQATIRDVELQGCLDVYFLTSNQSCKQASKMFIHSHAAYIPSLM